MKRKLNLAKSRKRVNSGTVMPVRFYHAAGFQIKIKKPARNYGTMDFDQPLVPALFLQRPGGPARMHALLPLFHNGPAITPATMLNERRLHAVLKMTRKKRC
ncbi:MAG: hypothetical protein ACREFR_00690 [Limisphaerales bacterium]